MMNDAPAITITHAWRCSVYGAQHVESDDYMHPQGVKIQYHYMPGGWSLVNDRYVCDRHKIAIDPKEK